jgi:pSer/pThr/pTyr-binding forkhead associated (FHA) protein
MPARLVAIDEGPDILLNRPMVVVGRHPACDTRLESLRVSRHHCCMTVENGAVAVRDLGSTNGIKINGNRVESGRLQPGDELSIAHIRYRLEDGRDRDRNRFNTPPPVPPYSPPPPRDPVNPWLSVRPSAWGLGPLSPG